MGIYFLMLWDLLWDFMKSCTAGFAAYRWSTADFPGNLQRRCFFWGEYNQSYIGQYYGNMPDISSNIEPSLRDNLTFLLVLPDQQNQQAQGRVNRRMPSSGPFFSRSPLEFPGVAMGMWAPLGNDRYHC